jgi:hypothetical protein
MNKASPKRKAAYLTAAILATITLIHMFTISGQMGWALMVMFLLGVIFAEFRHIS